jgi:hypothetical protein
VEYFCLAYFKLQGLFVLLAIDQEKYGIVTLNSLLYMPVFLGSSWQANTSSSHRNLGSFSSGSFSMFSPACKGSLRGNSSLY